MDSTGLTCKRCKKEIEVDEWLCPKGGRHQCDPQTFYIRTEGLMYFWHPEEKRINERGFTETVPAKRGDFVRGTCTTFDPEQIYFLKNYSPCCSAEEWQRSHFSPEELKDKAMREYDALQKKIAAAKEENALLEQVKGQAKGKEK